MQATLEYDLSDPQQRRAYIMQSIKRRGWTVGDVAKRIDRSVGTIQLILGGQARSDYIEKSLVALLGLPEQTFGTPPRPRGKWLV